jgi:type I restriction enzyme S subunit
MILRFDQSRQDPVYIARFISLAVVRQYFESFSIGATMDSISSPTVLGMPMPVPPIQEQRGIADFIGIQLSKFETLVSEARRSIELLQERRTALISAAVTGQIDVRGRADVGARDLKVGPTPVEVV